MAYSEEYKDSNMAYMQINFSKDLIAQVKQLQLLKH